MTCVALVGLMGTGKSTIGRLVAERTGARFVDVDHAIESRTGRTVRQLWEHGGEAAYRSMESEECLAALADDDVVLATPGGAVLDPEVRAALAGCAVVWLRADPAVLGARVMTGDHRPLLGDDPGTLLATMAEDRDGLYRSVAGLTIDTDRCPPEEATATILDWLDRRAAGH